MKKGVGRGESRKRAYTEDDELDPMDPSSYSDAPRGGWYIYMFDSSISTPPSTPQDVLNGSRSGISLEKCMNG
jgi:hypothetical protein